MTFTLIATGKEGVCIAESERQPGRYYVVTGVGTPFPVCDCPGALARGDCKHARLARQLCHEPLAQNGKQETR